MADRTRDEVGGMFPRSEVLDSPPEGWRVARGATTAPRGWVWVTNGRGRFSGRRQALVPEGSACDGR